MIENTNKAIAINSIILYGKMVINTICALLTTRFALQALGVVDYGLSSVLGGIISFISILNTIMLSTSNRFIAVAIGKGVLEEINKQFNVNLLLHVAIAILALFIAIPLGEWYIPRYVNYDGPLSNAMMVYYISVVGCVFSFVGVPYQGLLMAKERFSIMSIIDVLCHLAKLFVALLLINYFENKLLIYTLSISILTAIPTLFFVLYCIHNFREIVHVKLVREKHLYKQVFNFSAWVSVGAVASVGKTQGAALVVNAFFNTVMNTAMGVASSINNYITLFSNTLIQPMAPQITKSYAIGDQKRCDELLIMSTKYPFLLMLLIGSVFLVSPEWLLGLWLGEVPPYASVFLVLFIIDNLIQTANYGVSNLIFASGKISLFQITVSFLNILSVVLGYFVLRNGAPAYCLLYAYIGVSVIKFFLVQFVLRLILKYDNRKLWKHAYLPSIISCIIFIPVFFIPDTIHPMIRILITLVYLGGVIFLIGLSKNERERIIIFIKHRR